MLRIFGIVILNTKCKDCKSRKNLCTKNFTYTKKFYLHEIAVVDLSKIYFLKNAKKSCKPNNRDLNRDWITFTEEIKCDGFKVYNILQENSRFSLGAL